MLPVVTEFVRKYKLDNFIVVADSGLMNNDNIADLEANGYKYIIGARIKNESRIIIKKMARLRSRWLSWGLESSAEIR